MDPSGHDPEGSDLAQKGQNGHFWAQKGRFGVQTGCSGGPGRGGRGCTWRSSRTTYEARVATRDVGDSAVRYDSSVRGGLRGPYGPNGHFGHFGLLLSKVTRSGQSGQKWSKVTFWTFWASTSTCVHMWH